MPPISPLPDSTVRLLGSGVTITSPCDLVKELVENAIDARATSIDVSISADSISQVVVRDDGHGIALEDLASLGRRSHTSKIRTFDELLTRGGGDTLGFRGDALASANSIAGSVVVTTRTDKDPVASRLQLRLGVGGVGTLTKTSAPVGTTVHASKLFDKLPVRRRVALKDAAKAIARVKEILKSYALARPHLRLSCKVSEEVKGGTGGSKTAAWSFSPSPTGSLSIVHEAVLQVFGRELAACCVQVSRCQAASDKLVPLHVKAPPAVTLDAFLPKSGREGKLIQGKGSHISVDGRPISSARGFGKKLVKIYKSYLAGAVRDAQGGQGAQEAGSSSATLTNPFLRLNITCPPSTYDSNVAPLKDEVIFSDEDRVLACFEQMCRETYLPRMDDLGGEKSATKLVGLTARSQRSTRREDDVGDTRERITALSYGLVGQGEAPVCQTMNTGGDANEKPPETEVGARHDEISGQPQPRQEVRMRIQSRVNMARTASDTSIDTVTEQSLPAHLLPLSPVCEEIDSGPLPASKSKAHAADRIGHPPARNIAESIKNFLQPRREPEFQIAADETATAGREGPVEDWGESRGPPWRQPLQPLGDDEINQLEGLETSEWSIPDFHLRASRPPLGTTTVGVPVRPQTMRGSGTLINDRQASPMGIRRGMVTDSSSPPSRGQVPRDIASSPAAGVLHGIQTPPSSDPRLDVRNPNPPFRNHRHVLQSRQILGDAARRVSPSMNTFDRPRLSLDQIVGRSRSRERSSLSVDWQRLGSSEDLPYEVRTDGLEFPPIPPSVNRVRARPRPLTGGFFHASASMRNLGGHRHGRRSSANEGGLEARQTRQSQELTRQLSLESQPLCSIEVEEEVDDKRGLKRKEEEGAEGVGGVEVQEEEEEAASGGRRRRCRFLSQDGPAGRKRASQHPIEEEEEESPTRDIHRATTDDAAKEHRSKRRCTRAGRTPSGSKRVSSRGGPSGRMPIPRDEWKTQATWMEVGTSEREVGRWGRLLSGCEPYILSGRLQSGLPFRDMEGVREADSRLRGVVGPWMMRAGRDAVVEYTLLSKAKGKGPM